MKKLVAFLCAVVMLLLFAACAAGEGGKEIPGALPEILDRLYDTAEVDDATRDFLKTGLVTMDMPPEVLRDTIGLADMPDAEAVASEPTAEDDSFFCLPDAYAGRHGCRGVQADAARGGAPAGEKRRIGVR